MYRKLKSRKTASREVQPLSKVSDKANTLASGCPTSAVKADTCFQLPPVKMRIKDLLYPLKGKQRIHCQRTVSDTKC